ncbi:hypothetical protein ABH931_005537 [Streptacidiphilus sp. MAP12-33]|uniref:hypothetical protein n=1 Tax=Streptacidiphilus sp. MAP12-33 TaxID=3156266 RepID=UPI003516CBAA
MDISPNAPDLRPAPLVLPAAPMEPTRYSPVLPADLIDRTPVLAHQLAMLMAAQQYAAAPAPPPAPPVETRVSGRAKGAALVAVAGGTGVGAAATGVGYAAGLIASAGSGLMTAAIALAIATGSIFALTLLLRGTLAPRGGRDSGTTYVTQNVTATGLFGRAHGTVNNYR